MRILAQWLEYIGSIHVSSIDLGLQRMAAVAPKLSLHKPLCPVITVGGTNGKGSVMRFLETTYLQAGYRVGAYTSPHLHIFNERLCVNGHCVTDEVWIAAFAQIEKTRGNISLSFFEFTTLAALLILQQHALDAILLEVGLGGRLDAVNIIDADVAVVTSIALDHEHWLGSSREAIGREKAGIFRPRRPAICGDECPPQSLVDVAHQVNAQWLCSQQHFYYHMHADSWEWIGPKSQYAKLPLPILKMQNVATGLMAIECLQDRLPVPAGVIEKAIATTRLSGRFEVWHEPVTCIFDVAHNPASVQWFSQQLQQRYPQRRFVAVVGMLADKDIATSIASLDVNVDSWYFSDLNVVRGARAVDIERYLCLSSTKWDATVGKNWYNFASVAQAMARAVATVRADPEIILLVFGSFHTVAEAQQFFKYSYEAQSLA